MYVIVDINLSLQIDVFLHNYHTKCVFAYSRVFDFTSQVYILSIC